MVHSSRWIRLAIGISTAVALLLLFDAWPLLRGPQAWRWPLVADLTAAQIGITAVATLLFGVGWWQGGRWLTRLSERPSRRRVNVALLGLLLLTLLLQFAYLAIVPTTSGHLWRPLAVQFERQASDQASGYFTVAQQTDHLPTLLRHFPEEMPHFQPNPHPRSKPPGIILLYWGVEQAIAPFPALTEPLAHWARGVRCADLWLVGLPSAGLAANGLLGLLIPLLSALIIWPAYGFVARRGGAQAGWLAAGLTAVLPGRLIFTPHMDTVYPFLLVLALYWADTGLRRRQIGWSFLAGWVISVALFFSLVNGLIAVVVGLFVLGECWRERPLSTPFAAAFDKLSQQQWWRDLLRHGTAITAGTLSLWLIYWLAYRVTPLAIYHAAAPARHDLARDYLTWVIGNGYDLAMSGGLLLFLLAIPRGGDGAKGNALHVAFWLTLVVVTLSGVIRGEVGRIWLMMAGVPPLLVAISLSAPQRAAGLAPAKVGRWVGLPTAVFAITLLLAWVINLRWEVTTLEWPISQPRAITTTAPQPNERITAVFGDHIQLIGYDLDGDQTELTLYWHTTARPDKAYHVFIHLLNDDGEIVAQRDVLPQEGLLPTSCWQAGEYITDRHPLPAVSLPAADFTLRIGLYDQTSGTRLGEPLLLTP